MELHYGIIKVWTNIGPLMNRLFNFYMVPYMKFAPTLLLFILLNAQHCHALFHPEFLCSACPVTSIPAENGKIVTALSQTLAVVPASLWKEPSSYFIEGMLIGFLIFLLSRSRTVHKRKQDVDEKLRLALNAIYETHTSVMLVETLLKDVISEKLPEPVSAKLNHALECTKDAISSCRDIVGTGIVNREILSDRPVLELDLPAGEVSSGMEGHDGREPDGAVEGSRIVEMLLKDPDSICFLDKLDGFLMKSNWEDKDKCSVLKLGAYMGMSNTAFFNRLKAITGKSPWEYVLIYKMNKAVKLLALNNSVTDVASMLGYCDAKYFGRAFKKYYGASPTEYMKNHIGKDEDKADDTYTG